MVLLPPEHSNAAVVLPGALRFRSLMLGKLGWPAVRASRSMKSSMSLAFASRYVMAGRFHFRWSKARTEVWS